MLRRVSKSKGKGWIGGRDGGESGAQKPLNPLTPREALNQDLKPVLALRDRASDLFKKRKTSSPIQSDKRRQNQSKRCRPGGRRFAAVSPTPIEAADQKTPAGRLIAWVPLSVGRHLA